MEALNIPGLRVLPALRLRLSAIHLQHGGLSHRNIHRARIQILALVGDGGLVVPRRNQYVFMGMADDVFFRLAIEQYTRPRRPLHFQPAPGRIDISAERHETHAQGHCLSGLDRDLE